MTQDSIEITFNYILVYHKCLSVHSAVHFNHISKTIEVIMKLHIKMYLSPNCVKKHSKGQLKVAFNINLNCNTFSFNCN